eukprot:TRINITY_DN1093_c0_g2_i1.p1 TRINITY_DN1093_c0_g2~~TRINITY_DN1093_c0_g2_i1.p1  ORF type:complete len:319 (-),score=63.23 TRINITY_DN1093_c0_g2_i1:46-981(-)
MNRSNPDCGLQVLNLLKALPESRPPPTPHDGGEAWDRLKRDNQLFTHEESRGTYLAHLANEINSDVRQKFTTGQKPFATVLTCSDSRVSPEIIFGEGLGLLFVVRVAGNVIEPATLGTIEYGVHHLGTPLLLIMGHEKCGAVMSAAGATDFHGGVGKLLFEIKPSIDHSCEVIGSEWWKEKETNPELYDRALREAVKINALMQEAELLRKSEVIRHAVGEGKLKIVVAYYNLTSGDVEEVEERLREAAKAKHPEHVHHRKHKKKEMKMSKKADKRPDRSEHSHHSHHEHSHHEHSHHQREHHHHNDHRAKK